MRSTTSASSLPGSVSPSRRLPLAHEDLDAEFVLEILDVLADARLRGEQRIGDFGQVEVLAHRFADDAQLLEIHGGSFLSLLEDCVSREYAHAVRA
jgi:hypothetical protein